MTLSRTKPVGLALGKSATTKMWIAIESLLLALFLQQFCLSL